MKKIFFITLVCIIFVSCQTTKQIQMVYVIPSFACPIPEDPIMTEITPDIISDEIKFKEVLGSNILALKQNIALWKNVYFTCIQETIMLYKKEENNKNDSN